MAQSNIWSKLNSKVREKTHFAARVLVRAAAVAAIVGTYSLSTVGVIGTTGVVLTASTTPAAAWWRGGWRRGGWGGGWGWRRGGWGWRRGWHRGWRRW